MRLKFTVNGRPQEADDVWEGESLLYVLRERLGLPGSKNACEQGECGSCTVYLDGVPACACLVAAGQAQDREVGTVEGMHENEDLLAGSSIGTEDLLAGSSIGTEQLSIVQQAFIDAGAVQCGFCTPGLLVQTQDLINRRPNPSDAEIRESLAGNLCRCTGYEKIMDAVRLAAERKAQRT